MNDYFQFKYFNVHQDRCAMKVGTDGVLLGAWAHIPKDGHILDVGTGTGLLALMCAQRSENVQIDAVEMDREAAGQAGENCSKLPWRNRIRVVNDSFQSFAGVTEIKYDLIISNPPFFRDSLRPPADTRSWARHDDKLSPDILFHYAVPLLNRGGRVSLIYPSENIDYLISTAFFNGFHPVRKTFVKSNEASKYMRCLIEFGSEPADKYVDDEIAIKSKGNQYTAAYKELIREFYLKF